MKPTIHIKGMAEKVNICEAFDNNYAWPLRFGFDEETTDVVENVFLRIYECPEECSLEDAMRNHLEYVFGAIVAKGQEYGYSEYTIEGFSVNSLTLGGHDIGKILEGKQGKYVHILIDIVPPKS